MAKITHKIKWRIFPSHFVNSIAKDCEITKKRSINGPISYSEFQVLPGDSSTDLCRLKLLFKIFFFKYYFTFSLICVHCYDTQKVSRKYFFGKYVSSFWIHKKILHKNIFPAKVKEMLLTQDLITN